MTRPTSRTTTPTGRAPNSSGTDGAPGPARSAARKAHQKQSTRIPVPLLDRVELPPANQLAFLAGVGVLAIAGTIEWPIAVLLGVGHSLASQSRNKVLEEFGEALDEA